MKYIFQSLLFILLSLTAQSQTMVTIGNPLSSAGGVDGWTALMIVDETATYTNSSTENETISLDGFNFTVGNNRGRVTPFVVSVNGDNDFTVLAIGSTRVSGIDYTTTGDYQLDFSASAPTIILAPGESIAPGVMNANANGSGVVGSVVPFQNFGNEVWITGSTTSGSITVGNPIVQGANLFLGNRIYAFSIDLTVTPLPAVPSLSTWGLIILGLLILTFSLVFIKNRHRRTSRALN